MERHARVLFDDLEQQRAENALTRFLARRRPPPHIRDQLDLGYTHSDQSVTIIEIRPDWKDPSQKMETPVAKATFVRAKNCWKVYWMRSDLKWHAYKPRAEVATLDEFLALVNEDEHCCFFG